MTVVAEVVRNGFVESTHHGSVVALRADGSPAFAVGDVDVPMLARSSLKPLQATGMVEAGLDVPAEQLALACASHSGEPVHLAVVEALLSDAGLDVAALDNTPDWPVDAAARAELSRAGGQKRRLTQNCSGKHAAMLATCVAAGWPTAGYRSFDHPLQRSLRATVARLTGDEVGATVVDGCGAPMFAVTLTGLARGFAALATADSESAAGRCAAAMRAHPFLVGGTGRDVTELIEGGDGLIAKDGAEGVYAAALPSGIAVAVKIQDGAARARTPVLVAAIARLGVDVARFSALASRPVLGHGDVVGEVRAVL